MIKPKKTEKTSINKDIKINIDNDLETNNETIDSVAINLSREILDDLVKGKMMVTG
jgi:hypothetical protein